MIHFLELIIIVFMPDTTPKKYQLINDDISRGFRPKRKFIHFFTKRSQESLCADK